MKMKPKILDLFCGAGGCSVGYDRAGFEVIGVDIKPQPSYPFAFQEGDALELIDCLIRGGKFHCGKGPDMYLEDFAVIHASPPCQKFSVTVHINKIGRTMEFEDLLTPMRLQLMLSGKPYVIENVVGAPVAHPIILCGTMFGLRVLRHRLFETNPWMLSPPHPKHPEGNLTDSCRKYSTGETGFVCVAGHNFSRVAGAKAMGVDWHMTREELAQAIPPAYTEYIGKQMMRNLE